MADSYNCINLYNGGADRQLLAEAQELLYRGMWWCRMREAMLKIVSGTYLPSINEVDLSEFARNLGKGRSHVACRGPAVVALLDSLVCNIILENAISNAIRHGCPRDPNIRFEIRLPEGCPDGAAVLADGAPVKIQFVVSNRARPGRRTLQRWTGGGAMPAARRPPPGQPQETSLSDGIGLLHVALAAKVCGIEVELWQVPPPVNAVRGLWTPRIACGRCARPSHLPSSWLPAN